MTLEERKQKLEVQLKEIEINYHRVSGALALVNQLLEKPEKPSKEKKSIP